MSEAVATYATRIDQARDIFLGILSHDLRSPLNAIGMSAHMVPLVSNNPAEALACSHQITRSVSVMDRMIADLLDYTRTRLGAGMPVKPTTFDLAGLGRELCEEFRAGHPNREIQFQTDGDLKGQWDSDCIRQAISNLLGNAMQHGSKDFPVTLSLRGDALNVVITVHNAGDTIPPGELSNIFDPLVRGSNAERSRKNRAGSIGLGLYIAREVVKAHEGRIDVISTEKEGTTFTIRLPREAAPKVGQTISDTEPTKKA